MLLALLLSLPQLSAAADTDAPPTREPDYEALERYRAQEEFQYDRPEEKEVTVWQQFTDWLDSLFESEEEEEKKERKRVEMDYDGPSGNWSWLKAIPYIIIAILLGLLIFKGIDLKALFYRDAKMQVDFEEMPENLEDIDFNRQIADAWEREQYRMLVRLYYLEYLKHLVDKGHIRWRQEKTNREYLYEVTDPALRERFRHLIKLFEYVWYGDFPATEAMAREMEAAVKSSRNPEPAAV